MEADITGQKPATWAYAESFIEEDDVLDRARGRAEELGCVPVHRRSAGSVAAREPDGRRDPIGGLMLWTVTTKTRTTDGLRSVGR